MQSNMQTDVQSILCSVCYRFRAKKVNMLSQCYRGPRRDFINLTVDVFDCAVCRYQHFICKLCVANRKYGDDYTESTIYRQHNGPLYIPFTDVKGHIMRKHLNYGNILEFLSDDCQIECGEVVQQLDWGSTYEHRIVFVSAKYILKRWPQLLLISLCDPITEQLSMHLGLENENKSTLDEYTDRVKLRDLTQGANGGFRRGPMNNKLRLVTMNELPGWCNSFDVMCKILMGADYCCGECGMEYDCGIPSMEIVSIHVREMHMSAAEPIKQALNEL